MPLINKTTVFYIILVLSTAILAALSQNKKNYNSSPINQCQLRKNIRTNKFLITFSFIMPWLVSSLRFDVGADYFNYIKMYNEIQYLGVIRSLLKLRSEPGYVLLNGFVSAFFNNSQLVFSVSAFIALFFVYKAILDRKHCVNVGLAVFVYMILFYFNSFTTVRLSIALAMVFYAYKYLLAKQSIKYLSFILLASCFHYTALAILPISYLMSIEFKKDRTFYIIIAIIFSTFMLGYEEILNTLVGNTKYQVYISDYDTINVTMRNLINVYLLELPMIGIILLLRNRLYKYSSDNNFYVKLYFTYLIMMIIIIKQPLLDRMLVYMSISQVVLIPSILKVVSKREKPLVFIYIFCYLMARFIFFVINNPNFNPYNFVG